MGLWQMRMDRVRVFRVSLDVWSGFLLGACERTVKDVLGMRVCVVGGCCYVTRRYEMVGYEVFIWVRDLGPYVDVAEEVQRGFEEVSRRWVGGRNWISGLIEVDDGDVQDFKRYGKGFKCLWG